MLEWPSPIRSASIGPSPSPQPSRYASSGSRTISGASSSAAACSGVSTMSGEATGAESCHEPRRSPRPYTETIPRPRCLWFPRCVSRLLSLLSLAALAVAAPALAADSTVGVGDDFYDPSGASVNPGETVSWDWASDSTNDHTVTTHGKQIDRFNSGLKSGGSASFKHTFKYAGKFRYFCENHPETMEATVTVGTDDDVAPKVGKAKVKVSGHAAKFSFKLSERAVITVKAGSKRTSKAFGAGRHSLKLKRLKAKRYKGSFSAKDGFGNKSKTVKKRFKVS